MPGQSRLAACAPKTDAWESSFTGRTLHVPPSKVRWEERRLYRRPFLLCSKATPQALYLSKMAPHPKTEQTLVIVKPDGIQRALIGEIMRRYERLGLKLVALKMLIPTEKMIEEHYLLDPEWKRNVGQKAIDSYVKKGETPPSSSPEELGSMVVERLKKYMTSGPVIVMVWEGAHAVELVRKITGGTEPRSAGVGTIRGDFVPDSYQIADTDDRAIRNLIHASGSVPEAEKEIPHWFREEEIIKYRVPHEATLYDVDIASVLGS